MSGGSAGLGGWGSDWRWAADVARDAAKHDDCAPRTDDAKADLSHELRAQAQDFERRGLLASAANGCSS